MNENEFKKIMKLRGFTMLAMAQKLGISKSTFYRKLKTDTFGVIEAEEMIKLLEIDNPTEIFFDKELT